MKIYIRCEDDFDSELAFAGDSETRRKLAESTDSPELLEIYVNDPNARVRHYALSNPNISQELLQDVLSELDHNNLSDEDVDAIYAIANNPEISDDLRQQLLNGIFIKDSDYDSTWYVHCGLASNPSTPPEILRDLAYNHSRVCVEDHIAENPNTPDDVLEYYLQHGSRTLKAEHLARNPRAPYDIFVALAHDLDPYIRRYVARNKNTAPDILAELSRAHEYDVRALVASNPNTPPEVIQRLTRDRSIRVREAALDNHGGH